MFRVFFDLNFRLRKLIPFISFPYLKFKKKELAIFKKDRPKFTNFKLKKLITYAD